MGIDIRQRILALVISVAFMVLVVELVRRKRLKERYALVWLFTAFGILFVTVNYGIVLAVTSYFRILASSNTLLFTAVMFLVFISLHFSVKISALSEKAQTIAQDLALLRGELESMGEQGGGNKPSRQSYP